MNIHLYVTNKRELRRVIKVKVLCPLRVSALPYYSGQHKAKGLNACFVHKSAQGCIFLLIEVF